MKHAFLIYSALTIALVATIAAIAFVSQENATIHVKEALPTDIGAHGILKLPTASQIQLAKRKAYQYWGPTRCAGTIQYLYVYSSNSIVGRAHWHYKPDDPTRYFSCSITFNKRLIRIGFVLYCGVVIHEFGHLSGLGHSSVYTNIMFPVIHSRNIPKTCRINL